MERLYTRQFFQVFAAAAMFMTAVALQFHFGQYIGYLGYGVDTLGRVLSISFTGVLLIRLQIGRLIDHFGCRPVWLVGTLIVALATGSVQFVTQLWLIIALCTLAQMAVAASMTTVAVFAAQIAPPHRRAESIGTIGLAGFSGMIIGPTFGDWIFSGAADSIIPYRVFFSASAGLALLAGGTILRLHPDAVPVIRTRERQSQLRVILRHWPGSILLIAMMFHMVFCVPALFLERFADERGFAEIKLFFLAYAPTAMVLRIVFRRVPQRLGRVQTLLLGFTLLVSGLLCLPAAMSQAGLLLPGILMGAGHCFIFPSMVDLGAEPLPDHFRGTGTALILGAGDVGMILGFFSLGELIDHFGFTRALQLLASCALIVSCVFAISRWRRAAV